MAEKTAPVAAPPQEGDWPPGYVPGQGFINPPQDDLNTNTTDPNAPAINGAAPPPEADNSAQPSVPLSQLKMQPQNIDCPNCHEKHETRVKGRSEGKKKLHNVLWWPLPNRKHYWEKTYWYCSNCDHELAMQKFGKPLQVLAKQG